MKVHQIISEAEIKEWNPIDAVKKKLGSKTAATKMDIDAETKELAGEFTAFYKNTPDGAPTTGNLFDYLKKKGLPIESEQDIMKVLGKLGQRFGQKVSGALGKAKDYAGGKIAGAKAAVGQGINKIKQAGATGIKPEPQQNGGYPKQSGESMSEAKIYESAYNILKEEPLQPKDVTRIINHYVKSGFAGTAGGFGKSKYAGGKAKAAGNTTIPKGTKAKITSNGGDFTADGNGGWIAPDGTPLKPDHGFNKKLDAIIKAGGAEPQAKAAGSAVGNTGDPQLDKAIELVQANGYQVTK